MRIKVVVGRTEGFVSSVGLASEGHAFLCRGEQGLHWAPRSVKEGAVRELRYLCGHLQAAGVVVENIEALDEVLK